MMAEMEVSPQKEMANPFAPGSATVVDIGGDTVLEVRVLLS